jgi:hypothetical protein
VPVAGLAGRVDGWLAELGLKQLERAEREGATSWDVLLDGRRRRAVRMTLILDPRVALVGWVHYAPPLTDSPRKTYRQLLRWNDELPFAKFAITDDERPVLTAEIGVADLDRDRVGLLVARLLAICDLLYAESAAWVDRIKLPRPAAESKPERSGVTLLERYAADLGELTESYESDERL